MQTLRNCALELSGKRPKPAVELAAETKAALQKCAIDHSKVYYSSHENPALPGIPKAKCRLHDLACLLDTWLLFLIMS